MQNDTEVPSASDAEWHLSYMLYAATGEGSTLRLLVAGSAVAAERELKKRLDPYFHVGVVTVPMGAEGEELLRVMGWIPLPVMELVRHSRPGPGYYYSEFHYNDS